GVSARAVPLAPRAGGREENVRKPAPRGGARARRRDRGLVPLLPEARRRRPGAAARRPAQAHARSPELPVQRSPAGGSGGDIGRRRAALRTRAGGDPLRAFLAGLRGARAFPAPRDPE